MLNNVKQKYIKKKKMMVSKMVKLVNGGTDLPKFKPGSEFTAL